MARSIGNWMKLASLVEEHKDGSWLYRGESVDHGELKPKAGRIGSRRGAARKQPYDPFQIKSVRLYRPPHIAPRIPAQRSVFTYHPSPTQDFRSKKVVKYEIDKGQCGRIKNLLDRCAINESSLFPDIDGLSRYVGWRYKWAKFHQAVENDD